MSFTSHIFTSMPLVHTLNPDFLRRHLWLCFLLVRESPRSGNLHVPWFPNSSSIILPNFTDSRSSWLCRFMALSLYEFATSRLRGFKIRTSRVRDPETSQVQDSTPSRVRDSETSRVQDSRPPRVRDSETSGVQDSRSSRVLCSWKLTLQISLISTFRGWQVFLNSPALSTSFKSLLNYMPCHHIFELFIDDLCRFSD
jgi:hypothetical protein